MELSSVGEDELQDIFPESALLCPTDEVEAVRNASIEPKGFAGLENLVGARGVGDGVGVSHVGNSRRVSISTSGNKGKVKKEMVKRKTKSYSYLFLYTVIKQLEKWVDAHWGLPRVL